MSASSRPPKLLEYLMDHDFLPQDEGAWFDRAYKDYFSPGTPHGVIIAALETALALSHPPQDGPR